jgi:hypothetical protein
MKWKKNLLVLVLTTASCFIAFSIFAQPTSGLVAYWPMNGNYNDAGPNAINGTNAGSTASTNKSGAANSAMNFDNPTFTVVQYATHPINSNLNFSGTQNFTITFLFYLNTPWVHNGGFYDNCLNYNGVGIWQWNLGTNPNIQFNYRSRSLASTQFTTGVWRHVACVRNNGTLQIYIDGLLNASGPEGTGTPSYPFAGRFGTMFYDAQSPKEYNGLHGKMDELRIYNRALSATEIASMASIALPLQLGNFNATKQANSIQLNWETLSEENTSHFEVERSSDGINFTTIGNITALGNSTSTKNYSYTDTQPLLGINFYRLKMVDIDKIYTISRVVIVRNENNNQVLIFPNPATDVLQLQIPANRKETITISIADATGRNVWQRSTQLIEGSNSISIPVQQFSAGNYYITINQLNTLKTFQFIKSQ